MWCGKHLAGQQADCRPNTFSSRRKQMLDRDAQIRMSVIGLCVQERFNFLEPRLYG